VERSDLGIDLKPLQDLETFYAIDINKGVLINSVHRVSPAAKAGVNTQDILLELNGNPTNFRLPEEIAAASKMIADLPIGTQVSMKLKRGKETVSVTATTQKLEGAVGEEKELKTWGVSVRDVTHTYANERQLDDDLGVVVTTMSPGFPAQKAELQAGDVIRAVNGQQAADLEALQKLYQASIDKKESRVLLEIKRGRGTRSAVMKVNY
jgi:serine protease Do